MTDNCGSKYLTGDCTELAAGEFWSVPCHVTVSAWCVWLALINIIQC